MNNRWKSVKLNCSRREVLEGIAASDAETVLWYAREYHNLGDVIDSLLSGGKTSQQVAMQLFSEYPDLAEEWLAET